MFAFINDLDVSDLLPAGHQAIQFMREWAITGPRKDIRESLDALPPAQRNIATKIIEEIEDKEALSIPEISSVKIDAYVLLLTSRLQSVAGRAFSVNHEMGSGILGDLRKTGTISYTASTRLFAIARKEMRDRNWDKAVDTLTDAVHFAQTEGNLMILANLYCNLGVAYEELGKMSIAKAMHEEAIHIDQMIGNSAGLANHHYNLGRLALEREDLYSALDHFKKAKELSVSIGNNELGQELTREIQRITMR